MKWLVKLLIILNDSCSDKTKRIKTICQKYFTKVHKMKNTQSKIKPIKIGKQAGITYYFGCKDFTQNFRPEKVKMTNKRLRKKSHCVVCRSNKSRFLKQKNKLTTNVTCLKNTSCKQRMKIR